MSPPCFDQEGHTEVLGHGKSVSQAVRLGALQPRCVDKTNGGRASSQPFPDYGLRVTTATQAPGSNRLETYLRPLVVHVA